jgi:hypothetical protein
MTTYPNDLVDGDLADVFWPNALKNAFLNHKQRHSATGADPLDVKDLLDVLKKCGRVSYAHIARDGTGDYNCDGDQDEVQINQAISDAQNYDVIAFRRGQYKCLEPVVPSKPLFFLLYGAEILNQNGAGPIIDFGADNVMVFGGKFDGQANLVPPHSVSNSAFRVWDHKNIKLIDSEITNCEGHSIDIQGAQNLEIFGGYLHDTSQLAYGMDGICVGSGRNIKIHDTTFENICSTDLRGGAVEVIDTRGSAGWHTEDVFIYGNWVEHVGEFAFACCTPSDKAYEGYPRKVTIENNIIIDCGLTGAGVICNSGNEIIVAENHIHKVDWDIPKAISFEPLFAGGYHRVVEDGEITKNVIKGTFPIGIHCLGDKDNFIRTPLTVKGNKIKEPTLGIKLEYLDGAEAVSNVVKDCLTTLLLKQMGNATVHGNKIYMKSGASYGIDIEDSQHCSVKLNHLYGLGSHSGSIRETGTTSDYNIIAENVALKCPSMSKYGTHSALRNNDEWSE